MVVTIYRVLSRKNLTSTFFFPFSGSEKQSEPSLKNHDTNQTVTFVILLHSNLETHNKSCIHTWDQMSSKMSEKGQRL